MPFFWKEDAPFGKLFRSATYNIGRRDWTRTNDPHHVKVVL